MRSVAREIVLQFIFSKLFNQNDEGLFDVLAKNLSVKDKEFADDLYKYIEKDRESFEKTLYELSENFKADRIHYCDKCAILIGMAELKYFPDTPTAVVIDEAVNLAAKFSTENSVDYVNGILAVYSKQIRG